MQTFEKASKGCSTFVLPWPSEQTQSQAAFEAQECVSEIAQTNYNTTPTGLSGNEDCGQMSSWYIFSTMEFYSINQVSGEYVPAPFPSPYPLKVMLPPAQYHHHHPHRHPHRHPHLASTSTSAFRAPAGPSLMPAGAVYKQQTLRALALGTTPTLPPPLPVAAPTFALVMIAPTTITIKALFPPTVPAPLFCTFAPFLRLHPFPAPSPLGSTPPLRQTRQSQRTTSRSGP
ncbi:hypothetical protein D9615_003191 [Tricholomella constricta]|uniref:Glycosyl hydrolase family 92 domain-containing protein n=1 Tax=Tricholomella constricta TaxID=117010 RepID=A0A8H5HJ85_9AGAR|nr:hypothetical protein D9615_003191 [Tricholomella constricta]